MCTHPPPQTYPGYKYPGQFWCKIESSNPLAYRLCSVRKISHLSHPAFFSPPKCPSFQCSGASTLCLPQRHQLVSLAPSWGQWSQPGFVSRSPVLLAGSSQQPGSASEQAQPSHPKSSAWDLTRGHDRGMTRAGAQGLGLCPGRGDDRRGKKLMPLPAGSCSC